MIKNIIFFVTSPLTNRDYKRYGAEILIRNGFKVLFYDISPYIYPDLYKKGALHNRYKGDFVIPLHSKKGIDQCIQNLSLDSFVILLSQYRYNTFFLYWSLSRLKVNYAISLLNCIPSAVSGNRTTIRYHLRLAQLNPIKIYTKIRNFLYSPRWAKYLGIRSPSILLLGGEISINHSQVALCDINTQNLWLHTFDYDDYLHDLKLDKKKAVNKAVFIDAPSPRFKYAALIPGIDSPLTEEKFYPSLCHLFDQVESNLDVTVEIASHPGSDHVANPDYFGGRLTLSNKINKMIKNSKVVINRNSTALNFAVLYDKPVIFITSDEAETSDWLSTGIRTMASSIGKEPINIDDLLEINWVDQMKINKNAYSNYINMYIKKKGSSTNYLWQTVANKISELY